MATATVASTSNAVGTSVDHIDITKPSGLADGDLMIAVIGIVADGAAHPITAPAGWTDLGGTDQVATYASNRAFWKKADGNDAGATSFRFSADTSVAIMKGGMARITGNAQSIAPVDQVAYASGASSGAITPSHYMSTLVLMTMSWNGGGGSTAVSGQNVATTNPTWTESFDLSTSFLGGSQAIGVSLAYGGRSPITSTGAGGATITGGSAYGIWLLNVLPEPISILSAVCAMNIPSVLIILLNGFSAACAMVGATFVEVVQRVRNAARHRGTAWNNEERN